MTDVAALKNEEPYKNAIDKLWENVVGKKMYITGGIGSTRHGEAFGKNYELPNSTAYCETCAAIANCMWNLRMFMLHGDSKYIDVLERSLYNGVLSGISLDGKKFFYPNVLTCDENGLIALAVLPIYLVSFLQFPDMCMRFLPKECMSTYTEPMRPKLF